MIEFDKTFQEKEVYFTYIVLTSAPVIEERFNDILAICIAGPSPIQSPFRYWFGENLMFDKKKELLKIILENNYKSILKDHPDLFTDLKIIQKCRNALAHSTKSYQMKNDGSKKRVVLYPNRVGKETKKTGIAKGKEIDEEEMEKVLRSVNRCQIDLISISSLIRKEKSLKIITTDKTTNPTRNSS